MDLIAERPALDAGFLATIQQIGFHPFIMVRTAPARSSPPRYVICQTQNDAGQFVAELAALPGFDGMTLLRGIERALQLEIYDAAGLFFAWAQHGSNETLYIGLPKNADAPLYWGYPAFEAGGTVAADREQRTQRLIDAFEAYASTTGNDALRFALLEALAFGLSRVLGAVNRYAEAATVVDRALSCQPVIEFISRQRSTH